MADPTPQESSAVRASAPEPLAFLVGSWNRFEVLSALVAGTRTRHELRQQTGVSRPTLSRILADLTDRGWVRRHNDEYEATATGAAIASRVEQVVADIETAESLDGPLEWFQTERLGFPLSRLADAEVLTPTPEDHTRPMRQLAAYIDETSEMYVVATGVTYQVVDAIGRAGVAGELSFHCVMTQEALAGVRSHPELAALFAEMIDLGYGEPYLYDGGADVVDFNLMDERVLLCGISEDGLPMGIVGSTDETVMSWAAVEYERLRGLATPLAATAFTE